MSDAPAPAAAPAGSSWKPYRAGTRAVMRHELRQLLASPLAPVLACAFLLALSALIFLVANFMGTDETSLRLLLTFLPWVALVIVPALAMRAFADETGDRSLELVLTLPLSLGDVVVGKFLAGGVVLLAMLALTVPFPLTLACLGAPDWGAVASGYLGAALLLFTYLAVALAAAALVREPVAAFVVALAVLLALTLLGADVLARLAAGSLTASAADALRYLAPRVWLERLGAGRIELAALLAMGGLTAGMLVAAGLLVDRRRGDAWSVRGALTAVGAGVGGLAVLAVLILGAERTSLALDLTAAREFTLSSGTRDGVRRLPAGTEATLYWSRGEESVPAPWRAHARRVEDMLVAMARASGGRLALRTHDPRPDSAEELAALAAGIRRVPLSSGDAFMLGLTLGHGGRRGVLPFLDMRRDGLLEYDLANAFHGLARTHTPRLGIVSALLTPTQLAQGREGLSILAELKSSFDVAVVPHFSETIPDGLDTLLVVDATILKPAMLYAIDQYVMAGGNLIVMMDPSLRSNRASDLVTPEPSTSVDDVSDLLDRWGLTYQGRDVVGDAALAATVSDENEQRLAFPLWMRLGANEIARSHPATASLDNVLIAEPGAFAVRVGSEDRVRPLLVTTGRAGALPRKTVHEGKPAGLAGAFRGDGGQRILAAEIAGPFTSAFSAPPADAKAGGPHRATSGGRGRVIAFADIDWIFDPFAVTSAGEGQRAAARPLNDNHALLLNLLAYASGDAALIAIRSRGGVSRPFTRVGDLVAAGRARHEAEEGELLARIAAVEGQVSKVLEATGARHVGQLPEAIQEQIRGLERALLPARQRLRTLRALMREEIERLSQRVILANLLAGPVLVGALTLWLRRRRFRARVS